MIIKKKKAYIIKGTIPPHLYSLLGGKLKINKILQQALYEYANKHLTIAKEDVLLMDGVIGYDEAGFVLVENTSKDTIKHLSKLKLACEIIYKK
jgi:hypothetical protein